MTYARSNLTDGISSRTPLDVTDFDAFLFEDEFDDELDREIFAIRETLADFRQF
jgi:hypothetical protein